MDRKNIIEALEKWNFWQQNIDTGVKRTRYLKEFLRLIKIPEVIAIVGVRRCGKSVLCYQILESLIKNQVPRENTLFINFEDPVFGETVSLNNLQEIFASYLEFKNPQGRIYLFLDEVQRVNNWERFVLSLYDSRQPVKIFVTGSNSRLLSDKISTLLTGRYLTQKIYPLDFKEFLEFRRVEVEKVISRPRILNLLREYLKFGGFPRVVLEKEVIIKNSLLQEYYNTIIEKDVILKNNLKSKTEIKDLALYLMSNIGSLISSYSLAKKIGISHQNIMSYLDFFEEALLINRIPKFDVNVKKQIYNPDKTFVIDSGLSRIAGFSFSENSGHYLENMVFNHYLSQGKKIYYWKNGGEVDFLIKEGLKIKELVNVCYSLKDSEVLSREVRSLREAGTLFKDAAKKIVFWEKDEEVSVPKGVQMVSVLEL